ncbi:MAG: FAD-dependent oxidoreductase [Pseudomonadota bacterium]|nr:FAD-dependent oxidoreductase [Pseudomonadota bacterium]
MTKTRILLIIILAAATGIFLSFDLGQYLTLEYFKSQQAAIDNYRQAHLLATALGFFVIYVAVTGLSLPGAALMTLAAGAIFGLGWGTLIVSFASTIGATTAFLFSRWLLRDVVQRRFGDKLKAANRGIEKDGAFYLFTLRLVPVFPFFVINLVMGLTAIRPWTYYWVSQVGMLAVTLVYVNAGTQLAQLESLSGILSPGLIVSFALLGVFPLLARKAVEIFNARRVLRRYSKPKHFDRDLVVIGAGAGGLVSAYIGAAVKARVSLIEKHRMGGDCLNTGCVPSKALIRSARFLSHARRAQEFGFNSASVDYDFAHIMERVQRVIRKVEPHDSVERYTNLGVDCIQGEAQITSPYTVEVNGRTLSTRNIIVATGGRPAVPPIPGIEATAYHTSDTIWELRTLPGRLLVLGGGPIGCELTQCFARFGSHVIQLEQASRLLGNEDPEFSRMVMEQFKREGVELRMGHTAKAFRIYNGRKVLVAEHHGQDVQIEFDELLIAAGRQANSRGFGLEALGVPLRKNGTIEVNDYMQTIYPNIYAVGDVAGPYQFTHTAAHQAWYAAVNGLFGIFRKFRVDYSVIPRATFTDPEIARVGLNEQEARQKGIPYEVTTYPIDDLDRAIADEEAHGLVKVLTVPGKDRILGVTIAGEHAGDVIAEFVTTMRHGLGLNKVLSTIHIYPTLTEANKYVAGNWKRAHAPARILAWLERYHAWRRGSVPQPIPQSVPESQS